MRRRNCLNEKHKGISWLSNCICSIIHYRNYNSILHNLGEKMNFNEISPEEKNRILDLIPEASYQYDDLQLNTIVPKDDLAIVQYHWIDLYREITMRIAHSQSFSNDRFIINFIPNVLGNEHQYLLSLRAEIGKVEEEQIEIMGIPYGDMEYIEECGQNNSTIYFMVALAIIIVETAIILGVIL